MRGWLVAALALVAVASPVRAGKSTTVMIDAGTFHGDDVATAKPGIWQILCSTRKGVVLQSAQVNVQPVQDPLLDDATKPEAEKTGRLISVPSCASPVIVIRRQGLHDGAVATSFLGHAPLPSELPLALRLGAETYGVSTRRDAADGEAVDVMLTTGSEAHAIARVSGCCNDTWPSLTWAGDLDRDGKLDLLLQLSPHYAGSELVLFLSSAASGRDPVREVARFASSGC
jgi:hypothetical protein